MVVRLVVKECPYAETVRDGEFVQRTIYECQVGFPDPAALAGAALLGVASALLIRRVLLRER